MRGQIGKEKQPRKPRVKGKDGKGKGKRFRAEEAGRRKRTLLSLLDTQQEEQGSGLSHQRERLLAKAKHLAFPSHATGKYKDPFYRKQYGRDVSAGGFVGLPALHKRTLDLLLSDLLLRHRWVQVSGVLSVLLHALFTERDWDPHYTTHFWAAMEVTRQLEGLEGNDFKFRKMYQVLHDKQPKGPWARKKEDAGAVRLEMALYLMSQKHYDDANLASGPFMEIPPYRDHPVANLIHGLIHYYQWFELVKKEVEQESNRGLVGHVKREPMDLTEGVGENDSVSCENYVYPANFMVEGETIRLDGDSLSEDTSKMDIKGKEGQGEPLPSYVREDARWNYDENTEEENERSYMKKARVLYSADLDKSLFPFSLPHLYMGEEYTIPLRTPSVKNSLTTAIKHLRDALNLDRHSTAALLPLVHLMLSGGDVEGAYEEIEKCCQTSYHIHPSRIKCMLLESLTPRNNDMLTHSYEEVLERDPSSVYVVERLIDMHAVGDYRTESLVQCLGLHLDGSVGSILVWRKLASCCQKLRQAAESVPISDDDDNDDDGAMSKDPASQAASELGIFQQESVHEAWKLRERWWPVKHFRSSCIDEELSTRGVQWLVYKAAAAAHIFGSSEPYVLAVEKHLGMFGNHTYLAKLQKHKDNCLNLLAHVIISETS